jgi:hypothetical protein
MWQAQALHLGSRNGFALFALEAGSTTPGLEGVGFGSAAVGAIGLQVSDWEGH